MVWSFQKPLNIAYLIVFKHSGGYRMGPFKRPTLRESYANGSDVSRPMSLNCEMRAHKPKRRPWRFEQNFLPQLLLSCSV